MRRQSKAEFCQGWNLYHAVGPLYDMYVATRRPEQSVSLYYSYKGFYSMVILVFVDADYKFIQAEAGSTGSLSDVQVVS